MNGIAAFTSGKKTNLTAGWAFAAAVYMFMSGVQVDPEGIISLPDNSQMFGTLLAFLSVITATSRAATAKLEALVRKNGTKMLFLTLLPTLLIVVGCVGLGQTNPDTGNLISEDITTEITNLVSVFSPAIAGAVSVGVGSLLNLATLLGKAKSPPIST